MSGKATDVQKECTCDRTVLQNAQVVLENGQHTEKCRAIIEQAMVDKGDATNFETSGNQEDIARA